MNENNGKLDVWKGWQAMGSIMLIASIWLSLLDFPRYAPGPNSDHSWIASYGYFLKNHFQAGTDYVFTYGPLGFLLQPMYDADLFWHKFAWEMVVKLLFALSLLELGKALRGAAARWAACLTLAVFAGPLARTFEALYLFITLVNLVFLADQQSRYWSSVCRVVLLAVLSLTKFTLLAFIGLGLAVIAVYLLASRQPRRALFLCLSFAAALLVAWVALGQNLRNVPVYIVYSFQVAAGYTEAMALVGSPTQLQLGLTVVILLAASVLTFPRAAAISLSQVTRVALLGLSVFIQWKQGFVRHDLGHAAVFFCFALMIPFLLPAVCGSYDWRAPVRVALLTAVYLLSAAGLLTCTPQAYDLTLLVTDAWENTRRNIEIAFCPAKLRGQLHAEQARLAAQCALPRIAAAVRDAAVDVMSFEQAAVLLNRLNWHPRPMFQGYGAYTPSLLALNAHYFARETAPEFILFKLQTIDGRYPLLDDAQALLQVIHRYRPVLAERSFLLLQKQWNGPTDASPPFEASQARRVRLNEDVTLDGATEYPLKVSFDVRYTTTGKLRQVLYKVPPLSIQVRTADSRTHTYRLNPAMARGGFLINPLLVDNTDLVEFYAGSAGKRVVSFCLVADAEAAAYYKPTVRLMVERLPGLVTGKLPTQEVPRLKYPLFDPPPVEVQSDSVWPAEVAGTSVLIVHADSCVKLAIPPGARTARGLFGIHPEAYERGQTDGVRFVVEYLPKEGPSKVLFERFLNPLANPQDRGMHPLEVAMPASGEGHLLLKAVNLPGSNRCWDWSYWTEVHIE